MSPNSPMPAVRRRAPTLSGVPACPKASCRKPARLLVPILLAAALACPAAWAQDGPVTRITGTVDAVWAGGAAYFHAIFACEFRDGPSRPCTGSIDNTEKIFHCTNALRFVQPLTITGLDLSAPGPIEGVFQIEADEWDHVRHPDGSCTMVPQSGRRGEEPFTGTWDGTRGTIVLPQDSDGFGFTFQGRGTFTGTRAPPVFPMTVTSNITPVRATASAVIQYRAQDIGSTGSVYVFALAPADLLRPAAEGTTPLVIGKTVSTGDDKADPVACVLAQLNASGQLQAVSASSLQAFLTGVLSAQGQAVTIINGVPTATIGGATFYVGYGPSAAAMINNGINRSAVTVPGNRVCQPQAPQTGWWWNPAEGGRGYSIEASGNNLFMASYLYDVSGRATWHVAVGPTSIDGSVFSNQLLTFGNGVTLNGPYRGNTRLPDAGPISLTFDDATHGTLVWPGGTVAIERYAFGAGGTTTPALANQPENGWWWGGTADDGRGFFIEWQGNRAFLAGYMYDAQGNPTWYVADAPVANAQAFQGTWLAFANGQTLTGQYRAPTMVNASVAPVSITFQGAASALITLPSGTIPLTRFRF